MTDAIKIKLAERVRLCELFAGIPPQDIMSIAGRMTTRQVEAGKILYREGDFGGELCVVLTGALLIRKCTSSGAEIEIAQLGPLSVAGEISVLDENARSATCVALEDTEIAELSIDDLERLMREKPAAAVKLLYRLGRALAAKVRHSGGLLAEFGANGNAPK